MKKSELYRQAQIAVINSRCLTPEIKIDVLKILFSEEDLALFVEEQEAKAEEAGFLE